MRSFVTRPPHTIRRPLSGTDGWPVSHKTMATSVRCRGLTDGDQRPLSGTDGWPVSHKTMATSVRRGLTARRRDSADPAPLVSAVKDWRMVGQSKDSDGQQLPRASSKNVSVDNMTCFDLLYDRDGGIVSLVYITSQFWRGGQSSGAVWESRWPSWAVRPNEPSGFRGRKAILNHASALVSACP